MFDDHRLAIPGLAGDNRLESISNLIDHPGVGLLFCIPGPEETLRPDHLGGGRDTLTI